MKALTLVPLVFLIACNDHQKAPDDTPMTARPSAVPTTHTPPSGNATPVVTGTITVDDALKDKVPANATLFIMARPEGAGGPPALVKKIAGATFPYVFTLASDNVMMQGAPIPDKLVITARVDQDGDAMSRSPGDLSGVSKEPVGNGATGVALTLTDVL